MDEDGFMMARRRHRHHLYSRAKDLFQAKDVVIKHDNRKADDDEEKEGSSSYSSEEDTEVYDPGDDDPFCNDCDSDAEGVDVARWECPFPLAPGLSAEPWSSGGGRVHWPALPESVTLKIVAKLPFSAFCSFRSVCKEWNALIPDPRVMTTPSTVPSPPVCVMHWSACYNASTHDWHRLPASFHPQGRQMVTACDGLLLLRGAGSTPALWVVNPVNNSEMKLPELPGSSNNQGQTHALALDLMKGESNFQVFHIMECCEEVGQDLRTHNKLKVRIYNSEKKRWRYAGAMLDVRHVKSIVEFKGAVYALVSAEMEPTFAYIVKLWSYDRDVGGRRVWRSERIDPRRRIQDGNLFVRNGKLLLAVVLCSNLPYDNGGHLFRDRKGRMVSVWEMVVKDRSFRWTDIVAMPERFRDKLVVGPSPVLDVWGDFLWISSKEILNNKLEGRTYTSLFVSSGIMCHIPTNTWWELPHFRESPLYRMFYEDYEEKSRLYGDNKRFLDAAWKHSYRSLYTVFNVDSFLFQPRMDLIL